MKKLDYNQQGIFTKAEIDQFNQAIDSGLYDSDQQIKQIINQAVEKINSKDRKKSALEKLGYTTKEDIKKLVDYINLTGEYPDDFVYPNEAEEKNLLAVRAMIELLNKSSNGSFKLKPNKLSFIEDYRKILTENDIHIKKVPNTNKKGVDTLKKVVAKDDLYTEMKGVYVAKNEYVATDANILVQIKAKPKKENIGKILNAFPKKNDNQGKYIDAKFPNYKAVIPKYDNFSDFVELKPIVDQLYSLIQFFKPYKKYYGFWSTNGNVAINTKKSSLFNVEFFYNALKALKDNGAKKIKIAHRFDRPLMVKTDNGHQALIMPIRRYLENGEAQFGEPFSFIYNVQIDQQLKGLNNSSEGMSGSTVQNSLFEYKEKEKDDPGMKGVNIDLSDTVKKTADDIMITADQVKEFANRTKETVDAVKKVSTRKKNADSRISNLKGKKGDKDYQFFNVAGQTGQFLQNVERKPKESIAITLDGPQGSGKTTTVWKMMNDFAGGGNDVLFLSLEEHPESFLVQDKIDLYIDDDNLNNIDMTGDVDSKEHLYKLIEDYDIIFLDSWQKLLEYVGKIKFDQELRKKVDSKVFVVIFQQTVQGKTKGGAEISFDGDIIIKLHKDETGNFANNYAYFDKHRYTKKPIDKLKYYIASGQFVDETQQPPAPAEQSQPYNNGSDDLVVSL